MILEIAEIKIKPGFAEPFELGVAEAVRLFRRARGFRNLRLLKLIELPETYLLHVEWQTLEDHTRHFRESEDFQEWRRLVGEWFAEPPKVVHGATVITTMP